MLYTLFRQVMLVSLSSSTVILLTMLLMSLWGKRYKAGTRYLVWTLVLLRLCIPTDNLLPTLWTVEMPFVRSETSPAISVPTEPETMAEGVANGYALWTETVETPVETSLPETMAMEPVSTLPETMVREPSVTVSEPTLLMETDGAVVEKEPMLSEMPIEENAVTISLSWETVLPLLWFGGAVVLFAWQIWAYNRQIASLYRTARLPDGTDCRVYSEVCRTLGIRKSPRLVRSPLAGSPMMYGFFRPTVVLPDMNLTPDALRGILTHELTHYKRGDVWRKFFTLTARSLHWFNPLVYAASLRFMNDMEMACDETVLQDLDETKRREYGEMMLDMIRRCHTRQETLTTGFNPRKQAVLARFRNIMDTGKKKNARLLPALTAAACLLTGTVAAVPPTEGEGVGIKSAVRFEDEREKDRGTIHTSTTSTTNVVYTGKVIDYEDPTGAWEGWYHAELPHVTGETEWNESILADFYSRYTYDKETLAAGEVPKWHFQIGYETIKWQDTVTIVVRTRSLTDSYNMETEESTLVDDNRISHRIYHYNTKTKEFLDTDAFLALYTNGKWTKDALIEEANTYGYCRNDWGNPRHVDSLIGVIPSHQGNGQFDVCFSFTWSDLYTVNQHHNNLLVRVLDYQAYETKGTTGTDKNGETIQITAGEVLSPLMFRPSTDSRYTLAVYHQTSSQAEVQEYLESTTRPGVVWKDTYRGPQGIYTLDETLSPHTVDPTLTFVEKDGQLVLEVSFSGTNTPTTSIVCPCSYDYTWTQTEEAVFTAYGDLPVIITQGSIKGALQDWSVHGLDIVLDMYRDGEVPEGWEAWPAGVAIPEEAPVGAFWEYLKRLEYREKDSVWDAVVPVSEKVAMKLTIERRWIQKNMVIRVADVAFIDVTDIQ